MFHDKEYWLNHLDLTPHQEGGFFKEILASQEALNLDRGQRPLYTSIYFLLDDQSPSRFHRLQSDEIWYFHDGQSLTIHLLKPDGSYQAVDLGPQVDQGEVLQYRVPAGTIFGSSVQSDYSLVSCMVAPGFDYRDFELIDRQSLLSQYPDQEAIIELLS